MHAAYACGLAHSAVRPPVEPNEKQHNRAECATLQRLNTTPLAASHNQADSPRDTEIRVGFQWILKITSRLLFPLSARAVPVSFQAFSLLSNRTAASSVIPSVYTAAAQPFRARFPPPILFRLSATLPHLRFNYFSIPSFVVENKDQPVAPELRLENYFNSRNASCMRRALSLGLEVIKKIEFTEFCRLIFSVVTITVLTVIVYLECSIIEWNRLMITIHPEYSSTIRLFYYDLNSYICLIIVRQKGGMFRRRCGDNGLVENPTLPRSLRFSIFFFCILRLPASSVRF